MPEDDEFWHFFSIFLTLARFAFLQCVEWFHPKIETPLGEVSIFSRWLACFPCSSLLLSIDRTLVLNQKFWGFNESSLNSSNKTWILHRHTHPVVLPLTDLRTINNILNGWTRCKFFKDTLKRYFHFLTAYYNFILQVPDGERKRRYVAPSSTHEANVVHH